MDSLIQWRYAVPAAIVSVACGALIVTHYYYKNLHSYWSRKGVKGPKPWPVFGNLLSLLLTKNRLKMEIERVQKYGKVYGTYQGSTPTLVVADPEVVMQVAIKDFTIWPNHAFTKSFTNKYNRNFLIALKDDHWKQVRAIMSPTFTSGKIKRMFRFLDGCANDLVESLREQLEGKEAATVNVKDTFNLYSMDSITTCCYGLKLERQHGSTNLKTAAARNEFVKMALAIFKVDYLRLIISAAIPKRVLDAIKFQGPSMTRMLPMATIMGQLVTKRRQNSTAKEFNDYLQLLIDAKLEDEVEVNEMDMEENHHASLTSDAIMEDRKRMVAEVNLKSSSRAGKVTLDDLEILSNAIFFLIVGFETTGSLLAHTAYTLAFHQEVQAKLHKELVKLVESDSNNKIIFNYDTLTSCKYLDAVLAETLRLLSPFVGTDRYSSQDYHLSKYNIHLTANSRISFAIHAIHNDPDYWVNPERFNPDRFLPENKDKIVPGSYCPFGLGPRHCIGMRFSLTEAKLGIAKLLINFQLEPAAGTEFPPESKLRTLFLSNISTPLVKLVPRKQF